MGGTARAKQGRPAHEERFVDVDGFRTRYYDVGQGDPLLLIHGGEPGGASAADVWMEENLLGLGEHFRVLAPDRLAQGYTDNPRSPEQYRITTIAEHVASFLRIMRVGPATVVGQSRGAFIATWLAMTYPRMVERLVLVNSASLAPQYGADIPRFRMLVKGDVDTLRNDVASLSVTTTHITEAWVRRVQRMRGLPKMIEAKAAFQEVAAEYYRDFDLPKAKVLEWVAGGGYTGATLIVWGIGDPLTTLQDAVDLFQIFQNSAQPTRLHVIDRCGHFPFREYPTEFNDAVLSFIRNT